MFLFYGAQMEKKNMDQGLSFNIYYLNFSKVYEISMLMNNVRITSIQKENGGSRETSRKRNVSLNAGVGTTKLLAELKSFLGSETSEQVTSSSKLIETIDVKTTKSILLREIAKKCKEFIEISLIREGDLIKIDCISLSLLDEQTLRQFLVLRRDALKGVQVEGIEVNNFISSLLHDYSYILKGRIPNSNDSIVLKIPMDIENEFESKYSVDDLLIGHVSVIGIYKGVVTESFIRSNTLSYFTNQSNDHRESQGKVIRSSTVMEENGGATVQVNIPLGDSKDELHFIDIIAIVQDVNFVQPEEYVPAPPWYKKIFHQLYRGRK
jgi:hypothetical protein